MRSVALQNGDHLTGHSAEPLAAVSCLLFLLASAALHSTSARVLAGSTSGAHAVGRERPGGPGAVPRVVLAGH